MNEQVKQVVRIIIKFSKIVVKGYELYKENEQAIKAVVKPFIDACREINTLPEKIEDEENDDG